MDGKIVIKEGEPVLQFIGIKRKDTGDWALPGVSRLCHSYIGHIQVMCKTIIIMILIMSFVMLDFKEKLKVGWSSKQSCLLFCFIKNIF